MAELNYSSADITDMSNRVVDYSVPTQTLDVASDTKETEWTNYDWPKQLGYYKTIPELQKSIGSLALWTVGKGYTSDDPTRITLDRMRGWGEDSFTQIMWNMIVTKKISGDAFAEIIENDRGTLINLKPLNNEKMKTIVNAKGIIIRYEQILLNGKTRRYKPEEIFHISNDRLGDEIHGTSVIDACEWVILARNQAMEDWKKVQHRNVFPLRVIEVDSDDTIKIAKLKKDYEDAMNKGEVMIVPKGNVQINDSNVVIQNAIEWIRYLENFFYTTVGVPRVIANSEGFTEAGGKVGFLTFEPVYTWEQTQLEADLWRQLALKIKFNRPPSLGGDLARDEAKEGAAVQPNDTTAGVGA